MGKEMVSLRPITSEDTEKIVAWRNRDFVRKNFIYQELFTKEGHEVWLREQVGPGRVTQFIICVEAAAGSRWEIGSVYLRDIDREKGEAEYGVFIGEEKALGQGYGTQAAKLILDYGFETLGLKKIFLRFLEDNRRALKSYEKAGFRLLEDRRETVILEQGSRDVLFMEMDRDVWEKGKLQKG